MASVLINLVVIRSADIEQAVQFYQQLGLQFTKQRHGRGPDHYATQVGETVFEIYPPSHPTKVSSGVRLGFMVPSLDDVMAGLQPLGVKVVSPPQGTEAGYRSVVEDFDGHRLELIEAKTDEDRSDRG